MIRLPFSPRAVLVCGLVALPACQGTEPGDGSADVPELVYVERDEGTGLWSIQGYTEEGGSHELAPGQDGAPRPSAGGLLVRPTTGELLYHSEDPGYLGYLLLDPASGDVRRPTIPGVHRGHAAAAELARPHTLPVRSGSSHPTAGPGRRWDVERTHLTPETDHMWTGTRQALAVFALTVVSTSVAAAQGSAKGDMAMDDKTTMVGGQAMFRTKDIVDNAVNSADHTTLVAAVEAAGLVETLKGSGPFTVFAPTNAAFAALPEGTVPTLLKPENKEQLTKVLTYHVVPGRLDAAALMKAIGKGDGKATLTTASGEQLWVMMNGDRNIVVRDVKGGVATISTYDVMQSNGVIHVVDKVLLPS